ncbi:MAG: FAD-dependent oxidoreductase, partial [Christensenellaceae bacterium]
TENYAIDPSGKGYPYIPGLWNDEQIPGHKELADRVHAQGAKIIAQIYHAGRQTQQRIIGSQPVAPSAIPCPTKKEMPRELTVDEIKKIIGQFGDAALRAKKAGFDGIQVHGAHGYLITQFMSSYSNKRTDEYGGCFNNRARFAVEVVQDIRKKVGEDFIVDFKISGEEAVPEGMTIEDTKAVSILLEDAGVSSINVSIGVYASWYTQVQPAVMGHGWITDFAKEIKSVVNVPVTTVGRINDPMYAESIIRSGKADAVFMGRASLADPALPNKAKAGNYEGIIRCTACLQGCTTEIDKDNPGGCVVNPLTGRESEYDLSPAKEKKTVWVIGGGPSGAETAILAAQRGHSVTLIEAQDRLGGMYYTASIPPWKGEISTFLAWQRYTLDQLGVDVRLNTTATAEMVDKEKPDVVVIATGSQTCCPPITGIDHSFVRNAVDLLNGEFTTEGNIAIIGGGLVGGETANYLAQRGSTVAIYEMLPDIVTEEPDNMKYFLKKAFKEFAVDIHVDTRVISINKDGTITYAGKDGMEKTSEKYDMVLLSTGMECVNNLYTDMEGKAKEIYLVGDARVAGNALSAIREGYELGLKI